MMESSFENSEAIGDKYGTETLGDITPSNEYVSDISQTQSVIPKSPPSTQSICAELEASSNEYVLDFSLTQPVVPKSLPSTQSFCAELETSWEDKEVTFKKCIPDKEVITSSLHGNKNTSDYDTSPAGGGGENSKNPIESIAKKNTVLDEEGMGVPIDQDEAVSREITQHNGNHIPKKGYHPKANLIPLDISSDLFPLWVSSKKRKGKTLKLKVENFDSEFTSKKQAGFSTTRPVRWALALEQYVLTNTDIKYSWYYKSNQKFRKYSDCIVILNHALYTIHISISFSTGVILVDGDHKYWVQKEFPSLLELFQVQMEYDHGEETDPSEKQLDELSASIECLWQKNEELMNTLNNHDDVIQKIIERCQNSELKINDYNPELTTLEAEKAFDKKLTAFMDFMLEDFGKSMKKLKDEVNMQIQGLHKKIDNIYKAIIDKIKELNNKHLPVSNEAILEIHKKFDNLHASVQKEVEKNSSKIISIDAEAKFQEYTHNIPTLKNDIEKCNERLAAIEQKDQSNAQKIKPTAVTTKREEKVERGTHQSNKHKRDILMIFDSNGNHIDHKRLWRLDDTEYARCGQFHTVSKYLEQTDIAELNYLLLNVGCNELDLKDHKQVFGEMELLVNQIREKYKGVKLIISEITPRTDDRDQEVRHFNGLLVNYAKDHNDVTVAFHHNLRDPEWSFYTDEKHVHPRKIGKFTANIIRALLKAYNIKSKSELFAKRSPRPQPQPLMSQLVYDNTENLYPKPHMKSLSKQYLPNTYARQAPRWEESFSPPPYGTHHGALGNRLRQFAGYPIPTQHGYVNNEDTGRIYYYGNLVSAV